MLGLEACVVGAVAVIQEPSQGADTLRHPRAAVPEFIVDHVYGLHLGQQSVSACSPTYAPSAMKPLPSPNTCVSEHFRSPNRQVRGLGRQSRRPVALEAAAGPWGSGAWDSGASRTGPDRLETLVLKPVDPLFEKNGAGAFLRIHVEGTARQPKFGVDLKF